jgi:hypothetical protein
LCGAGNWAVRKVDKKCIETVETWCWKRMGKTSLIMWKINITKSRGGKEHPIRRLTGLVTSCRNFLLKRVIDGNVEGRIGVMGRRGRRRKQLLDDLKDTRRYWKLKEATLDRTVWRTRFGRGCGPVLR